MVATVPASGQVGATRTFDSLNPATSEPIATFPIFGADEVTQTVSRAREAAAWWSGLDYKVRQTKLLAWKSYLTRYIARLAELVHAETGKPVADAELEILLAVVHIDWAAKNARKVLGPHRVRSGIVAINQAATVEYHPLGVVGVIGPWNYPVFTPMGSIAYALAAGNAVVFKPSEFTPAVGAWLVNSFAEVVPEHPVLQLATGFGETGGYLARSGVDKIAFTGSAKTAKKVMAACAENLTPLVAECGGKDALLVAADADVEAAADAAVWGAMSNAGQTCIGVERIYVAQEVYHTFLEKVAERVSTLRPGDDREADYGPMTMPGQVDVVERHIADAMACGGRAVVGGLGS
ncbi:MAG: aldehyde dehydrogenase family protein, partial [Actinomycetota bacterium]|nr:aldehyde dehydrogenase family protein [Actinomycetota bacterium]